MPPLYETILNDPERLAAIRDLDLLDSSAEKTLDRLTKLATKLISSPVALISIVDHDRQFFKSAAGLEEPWANLRETPLRHSLCQYVVARGEALIVKNVFEDAFIKEQQVDPELGTVSYLGVPLQTETGLTLGSFCVIDRVQRQWTEDDLEILGELAQSAMAEIKLRHELKIREEIERSLRQSETLYRNLFEQTNDGVVLLDLEGSPLSANQRAADMLGYSLEELMQLKVSDLVLPAELEQSYYILQDRLLKEERIPVYERDMLHKNGDWVPVEINLALVRDQEGKPTHIQAILRDIHKRKKAEKALKRSEEHYRSVVNALAEGILVLDREAQIINSNPAATAILGLPDRADLSGYGLQDSIWEFISVDGTPFLLESFPIHLTLSSGQSIEDVVIGVHKADQTLTWVQVSSHALWREEEKSPYAVVVSFTDITALKETLQERTALIENLDSFSRTVAHDLKNPAGLVLGYAELIKDDLASFTEDEIQEYLDIMHRNAKRMVKIIDALLLLASTRQLAAIPIGAVDMGQLVDEALERLSLHIQNQEARINLESDFPQVLGYAPWIEEVLVNYLSNALKYGGIPPEVWIGAEYVHDKKMVRYWVRDNGNGIPLEAQKDLFTPFTRVTDRKIEGHGLGLAIVRQIIERLDGKVAVKSESGAGSEFSFTLPAAQ
ncbi:hypothetical protein MASR2M15_18450 [Anaerolineales bacterium]